MKLSISINRILRNTFPVKFYYHFSLVNWTAATESATSYEHAHCAWYGLLIMTCDKPWSHLTKTSLRLIDHMRPKCREQVACGQTAIFHLWSQKKWPCGQSWQVLQSRKCLRAVPFKSVCGGEGGGGREDFLEGEEGSNFKLFNLPPSQF